MEDEGRYSGSKIEQIPPYFTTISNYGAAPSMSRVVVRGMGRTTQSNPMLRPTFSRARATLGFDSRQLCAVASTHSNSSAPISCRHFHRTRFLPLLLPLLHLSPRLYLNPDLNPSLDPDWCWIPVLGLSWTMSVKDGWEIS